MPAKKPPRSGQDAVDLLKKDHDDVRKLFDEFETADEDRKFELAAEICQALTVHSTIEEEIFYPQVREAVDAEDVMLEAEIEHDTVKQLIERVQAGEVDEVQLSAMIKVMQEYVNHHVNEEQRKMFPRARRSDLDLEQLGRELTERRAELEGELKRADEPDEDSGEDQSGDDASGRSRGGMAARDATDD
jgi:hemerythrin superfamily protein